MKKSERITIKTTLPILRSYIEITLFVVRRIRGWRDVLMLAYWLLSPFLYKIGYIGDIQTPLGRFHFSDRTILRSSFYGLLKTNFTYLYVLKRLLPERLFFNVVIDVGANIGDFTVAIKDFSRKIVAIEPERNNFIALCTNLTINGLNNSIPLRVAAHDREEEIFLTGESSNTFVTIDNTGQSVKGMPLDLLSRKLKIKSIDLLKIDVQGHEKSVLLGMRGILQQHSVRLIIMEVHLKRKISVEDIVSFLETYGYYLVHKDTYLFNQPHLYFTSIRSNDQTQANLN